jgi:hypothetical protein
MEEAWEFPSFFSGLITWVVPTQTPNPVFFEMLQLFWEFYRNSSIFYSHKKGQPSL